MKSVRAGLLSVAMVAALLIIGGAARKGGGGESVPDSVGNSSSNSSSGGGGGGHKSPGFGGKPAGISTYMIYGADRVPNASAGSMITTHFVKDGSFDACNQTECSNAVDKAQGKPILVYCANLPNRGPYDFYSDGTVYDLSTGTKLNDDYASSGCDALDGECYAQPCLGTSCNATYQPSAFGTSWKSIPCTIAAIAEQGDIAKKFLNDNNFAAGIEPEECDTTAPKSTMYNTVFTDSSDDDVAPESVVTLKWVLTCENVMGNVLHQRTQSISVCVNNTDTSWVPTCETSSNIVTCAYADASISGTSTEMAEYRCDDNDWSSWLRMTGGTMPA